MQPQASVRGQWHIKSAPDLEDPHLFDVHLECMANQFHISYSIAFYSTLTFKQDRKCMYRPNIEARSLNHFCRGYTVSITYSGCASVALVIQQAKHMWCIVLSCMPLFGCTIFFHTTWQTAIFSKKKNNYPKMRVLIFYTFCLKYFPFQK
jgi:hypothetical protein